MAAEGPQRLCHSLGRSDAAESPPSRCAAQETQRHAQAGAVQHWKPRYNASPSLHWISRHRCLRHSSPAPLRNPHGLAGCLLEERQAGSCSKPVVLRGTQVRLAPPATPPPRTMTFLLRQRRSSRLLVCLRGHRQQMRYHHPRVLHPPGRCTAAQGLFGLLISPLHRTVYPSLEFERRARRKPGRLGLEFEMRARHKLALLRLEFLERIH